MPDQATQNPNAAKGKKTRNEDEQIAKLEERLKKLKEEKRKREQATREKNAKAILDLIRTERLDTVDVEKWQQAVQSIKTALEFKAEHL
jgi:superfamily I DNA and/or RNA helicase